MGLGLNDLFDEEKADLSGISSDGLRLYLDEVVQRARIKVDEKGVEAAAATVASVSLGFEPDPPKPVPFIVDRPFFFLIRDHETGLILFMGSIRNPIGDFIV